MPIYEYRCRTCNTTELCREPADDIGPCAVCDGTMKRVWSVQFAPIMQEHFNLAVGKPISDRKQMDRELRRASELATERTGIPHNFVQIDGEEAKRAAGIDDEMQQQISEARRTGRPLPRSVRDTTQRPTEWATADERRRDLERVVREGRASSGLRSRGKATAEPLRP